MQILKNNQGYATRQNAIRKITKALGDALDDHRWFIIALPNGRFMPAVTVDSTAGNVGAYASAGLAVVGS